jgi:hypothetical protein
VAVPLFIGNLFCRLLFILKSHSGILLTESHCYAEQFTNSCSVTNYTFNKCEGGMKKCRNGGVRKMYENGSRGKEEFKYLYFM